MTKTNYEIKRYFLKKAEKRKERNINQEKSGRKINRKEKDYSGNQAEEIKENRCNCRTDIGIAAHC